MSYLFNNGWLAHRAGQNETLARHALRIVNA
jgi:hypothetical protein